MASIDNALTTLNNAKAHMDISSNSKNAVITKIILGASAFVEQYCRRKFGRTAYTNELISGGGSKLFLRNTPIISGETFLLQAMNGAPSDNDWRSVDGDHYAIDYNSGSLSTLVSNWFDGIQNYRANYTAGYYLPSSANYQDGVDDNLDLPYDLELAVLDLVSAIFNKRKSGGVTSERVYQVSITYAKALKDDPITKEILDHYKVMSYR